MGDRTASRYHPSNTLLSELHQHLKSGEATLMSYGIQGKSFWCLVEVMINAVTLETGHLPVQSSVPGCISSMVSVPSSCGRKVIFGTANDLRRLRRQKDMSRTKEIITVLNRLKS